MMNDYVLPPSPAVHGELRRHERASILQTLLQMLQEAQDHQPLNTAHTHLYSPVSQPAKCPIFSIKQMKSLVECCGMGRR